MVQSSRLSVLWRSNVLPELLPTSGGRKGSDMSFLEIVFAVVFANVATRAAVFVGSVVGTVILSVLTAMIKGKEESSS